MASPQATWIPITGAVLGGLAVALGAFGAHWLSSHVASSDLELADQQKLLDTWEVAVRYQLVHALALLAGSALVAAGRLTSCTAPAICMVVGTLIFSGCLYLYVLSGLKLLGAIVPIGGVMLIAGWGLLAWNLRR